MRFSLYLLTEETDENDATMTHVESSGTMAKEEPRPRSQLQKRVRKSEMQVSLPKIEVATREQWKKGKVMMKRSPAPGDPFGSGSRSWMIRPIISEKSTIDLLLTYHIFTQVHHTCHSL